MARWNIKTINSSTPAVPMGLRMDYLTLDKDSGANMQGTLVRNVIAHKMKFYLTMKPMTASEMTTFLGIIKPDSLTIVYYDIFDGTEKTGTFYHGDISIEPHWYTGTSTIDGLYKVMDINLIEY